MGKARALLLAGAAVLAAASAAAAADLPPEPVYVPPPEPIGFEGWYLRGDVGVGIASGPDIRSTFYDSYTLAPLSGADAAAAVPSFARQRQHLDDAAFLDVGVGYQVNNWLRLDATGEYRTDQHFSTLESYDAGSFYGAPGNIAYDKYTGSVQSSVFLLNAYADLGTWWRLTPFIGAGIGAAYNRVSSVDDLGVGGPNFAFTDQYGNASYASGVGNGGYGYAKEHDQFSLAYAAMAGVSYAVTPNVRLELGYRYLNLGEAKSGLITCVNSNGCVLEKHRYDLESQDIRLGMRWLIEPVVAAAPFLPEPPIVRKY